MFLISAPSLNSRFTQLLIATTLLLAVSWFLLPSLDLPKRIEIPGLTSSQPMTNTAPAFPPSKPKIDHPIDHLTRSARIETEALLAKESQTARDAARAYRDRRKRQPPPGFDRWFEFAKNHSAIVVEDFFDQIYHDLDPFWGVSAKSMRDQANDYLHRISVRDGKTTQRTDVDERPWLNLWQDMVQSVAEFLPDVDMAINEMDESRMVVPWEDIDEYMEEMKRLRRIVPKQELRSTYHNLKSLDAKPPPKFDPEYIRSGPYWALAVAGCPRESEARKSYIQTDFKPLPPLPTTYPNGSYEGYVQNWTLAKSPCDNPSFQGLHGTFVEPISISTTKKFFPLFGGSKLPMNNEILLPAAMYWSDDPFYSGGKEHGKAWAKKEDKMIWRGAASGGRNREENWTRFQRHRFVSMLNATSVHLKETQSVDASPNFVLPADGSYNLAAFGADSSPGDLSKWIESWSDAAVVNLLCFPSHSPPHCPYTDPYFTVKKTMPMKEQYSSKYLPDIDGNSFSGRYRGFLGSTSMPIKATIYQEWHDSRLVPWKHFVPMDNTFIDIYGIMEYFIGNRMAGIAGHDEEAEDIALSGKQWAEKVLRKEDMQIYVFRLLLEYARLCDDDREKLGWSETSDEDNGIT